MLYNSTMRIRRLHEWDVNVGLARELQLRLAKDVVTEHTVLCPSLVAGADISSVAPRGLARAAVVVLEYPGFGIAEVQVAEGRIDFPYIPGLLSFREIPLILACCEKLGSTPDLVLVDGQGIAHPRRIGLAAHLGLFLDLPTIGCAKSILCGSHQPVEQEAGASAGLFDDEELIGAALRTRAGVKPVYVSVGHKIDLAVALEWVVKCCRGYRLPEPIRLAHLAAGSKGVFAQGRGLRVSN